ncbi:MAG: Eco57I restriction-modification methylase domain-containing protein [Chloroflexota bacterium]|nr:Eco57I restriction-modification methylase domain-containing protein [Chloroflexota bacterium]MDE2886074.1 Eco57I restriction-modification methylase domain-containing protein [Chloroflexota bacterium]
MVADGNIADILADFGGDPQRAEGLAEFLGFEPISNPEDRLAGALSGELKQFLRGRRDVGFGIDQLYRVGSRKASPAQAGLWIGVLSQWGYRSSDRDRARRRVTRALVEHVPDRRSLALLVPPSVDGRPEAELVFPRTQTGASNGAVTSVRAHLDLANPTRFHRELLDGLRIPPGASLLDVSKSWQRQFSVERVTTKFYREYADVRDRIAGVLLAHNQDHPVVKSFSEKEARNWATRQMGRVLFLWFLQAKRWLGEPGGMGSVTYLLDLWAKRGNLQEGEYFRGILSPMFFDAMATGSSSRGENSVLGFVPYLNGGLFRRSALEDRINDAGEVSLPDDVFDPESEGSLLNLLSRYRFTTRESTPDDQSVDPDPELLGRVFENLYQGDERRKTGTYYTPREVVHFMCREAMDGYLRDATGVDQGTLDALRQEAVGSRDEYQPLPDFPADALIRALETVRVCDPAVGSGAFLLGTIQEIVALRRGILFSQKRYIEPDELYRTVSEWKRRTIENSLYGVDINPEAVEICRLRLWLSMVLDLDEPPPANSDWALPNLDFQIVAGDSLVDRAAGVTFKESWPAPEGLQLGMELQSALQRLENDIAQRKREFERTHRNPKRLRELRDYIAQDQREIVRLHLAHALERAEADLEALRTKKSTKPALRRAEGLVDRTSSLLGGVESSDFALVQKPFLWPIAFPEVLREGDSNAGFDIVLANPPYVKHEKLDSEDQRAYEEAFSEVYAGTADILVYFYARALQILRPNGWLAFITSNKFMRADYGTGIREHVPTSLRIRRVIDFGDLPLFEANGKAIAAYPAVLVGNRSRDVAGHVSRVTELAGPVHQELAKANLKVNPEGVRSVLEDLDGLLSRSEIEDFPQALLKKDRWILEDPHLIALFERVMNQGTPLREFVNGRIYYGVKTGHNPAFVINEAKRKELIEEDPRSAELIRPWLRGEDIKRWKPDWAGCYIIFTRRGVDIDEYPAIRDYLSWWRANLQPKATSGQQGIGRKPGDYQWYEIQDSVAYHSEFSNQKVVWGNLAVESKFAKDLSRAYVSAPANCLIEPVPWLLPMMNSSLLNFVYPRLTVARGGSYQEFKIAYIEPTPIATPDSEAQSELERLASEIIGVVEAPEQVAALEREIDTIVFDTYGLSASERQRVLDWLDERREALGVELPLEWRKLNALRATAGVWKDSVDGDQLIQNIRASRDIHTRPVPRL